MARREFPAKVRSAVIKRATVNGMQICELCNGFARRFQIDHRIPDSHGGEPVLENAQLICEACYAVKNAKDTTVAAKLKRIEAKFLGAKRPSSSLSGSPARRATTPVEKIAKGPSGFARQIVEIGNERT